jgi:hypothetical protein
MAAETETSRGSLAFGDWRIGARRGAYAGIQHGVGFHCNVPAFDWSQPESHAKKKGFVEVSTLSRNGMLNLPRVGRNDVLQPLTNAQHRNR